jgi:hypothetical protein
MQFSDHSMVAVMRQQQCTPEAAGVGVTQRGSSRTRFITMPLAQQLAGCFAHFAITICSKEHQARSGDCNTMHVAQQQQQQEQFRASAAACCNS